MELLLKEGMCLPARAVWVKGVLFGKQTTLVGYCLDVSYNISAAVVSYRKGTRCSQATSQRI